MTTAASPNTTNLSPPLASTATSCDPHSHGCRWWPYSNSNDFGANTAMILILLLCVLICALALNTAIRCFLRGGHYPTDSLPLTPGRDEQQKPNIGAGAAPLVEAPALVYSAWIKLGGAEAVCAICLSEFIEGELIQVLGKCKHGFHVNCIEQWLSCHPSCPTCRRSCFASISSSQEINNTSRQPTT